MKKQNIKKLLNLWREAGLYIEKPKQEIYEAEKMLLLNPSSCFVAMDKNQLVGSIFGIFNGRRAWIYHLAISKQWQKKGVGTSLLQKTEVALKGLGATRIILWVELSNLQVVPFYEKNGFVAFDPSSILMKKELMEL